MRATNYCWKGTGPNGSKLQPYLIGLLLAKGVPLLWQGQELVENYTVPYSGLGRVMEFRPLHWEYFYDAPGQGLLGLVRKLLALRKGSPQFRNPNGYYFYNDWANYQSKGLLLFSRTGTAGEFSLVALNFSGQDQTVPFNFPQAGNYLEQLYPNTGLDLTGVAAGTGTPILLPSNFGRVWTNQ